MPWALNPPWIPRLILLQRCQLFDLKRCPVSSVDPVIPWYCYYVIYKYIIQPMNWYCKSVNFVNSNYTLTTFSLKKTRTCEWHSGMSESPFLDPMRPHTTDLVFQTSWLVMQKKKLMITFRNLTLHLIYKVNTFNILNISKLILRLIRPIPKLQPSRSSPSRWILRRAASRSDQ